MTHDDYDPYRDPESEYYDEFSDPNSDYYVPGLDDGYDPYDPSDDSDSDWSDDDPDPEDCYWGTECTLTCPIYIGGEDPGNCEQEMICECVGSNV